MPVALVLKPDLRLVIWRLSGLIEPGQFVSAFRAEAEQHPARFDPLTAGTYPVLAVFEEDTELHRLDREALAEIAAASIENWRPYGISDAVIRGAILCPSAMHRIVSRLFLNEAALQPGYRVNYRIYSTAAEAGNWLQRPLSGLDLPVYAAPPNA